MDASTAVLPPLADAEAMVLGTLLRRAGVTRATTSDGLVMDLIPKTHMTFTSLASVHCCLVASASLSSPQVTSIGFGLSQVGDTGALAVAEAVRQGGSCQELRLERNSLGLGAAVALGGLLRGSSKLQKLRLNGNSLGDQGMQLIADSLRGNHNMTLIFVASNKVSDAGAAAVAEMLVENESITSLSIAHNRIGPLGARCLGKALRANLHLKELYLAGNIFDEAAARSIINGWGARRHGFMDLKIGEPQVLSPRMGAYLVPHAFSVATMREAIANNEADMAPPAA